MSEPMGFPPKLKKLLWWTLGITVAVIGLTWVLFKYSGVLAEREAQEKELATAERGVQEQREREKRELASFAQVDAKKGIYRISLDRALALVAENHRLLEPVVKLSPPAPAKKKTGAEPAKQ